MIDVEILLEFAERSDYRGLLILSFEERLDARVGEDGGKSRALACDKFDEGEIAVVTQDVGETDDARLRGGRRVACNGSVERALGIGGRAGSDHGHNSHHALIHTALVY